MSPVARAAQPFALEVYPGEDRWHWRVATAGAATARGDAPSRDAAQRCGELTAAAIDAFGRIGRRRF